MKKDDETIGEDELRPEYNLSELKGGVRGKYLSATRLAQTWLSWPLKCGPRFPRMRQ